ncbi:MAG: cytochrome-c peroxidase, partial [Flavobacteriales bacterium]|nr:cytochrome-c peroxidase [Flavobacteriales bacterium]
MMGSSKLIVPAHFDSPSFPADNAFSDVRWELGKKLFFDPILSRDESISCASCHLPEQAFSDEHAVSVGVEGRIGTRNSP